MNVVERGLRFQLTTAPETKFAPYTLSVNAPLPGTTACGTGGPTTCGTGLAANAEATSEIATAAVGIQGRDFEYRVLRFMGLPSVALLSLSMVAPLRTVPLES